MFLLMHRMVKNDQNMFVIETYKYTYIWQMIDQCPIMSA